MVTVQYFNLRGRAEAIKVALSAKDVTFDVKDVDYAAMKSDLDTFTFGQVPRYCDDELPTLCQSNAILRHIGRRFDMYGKGLADAAHIDAVLDGVESIRVKYITLIYQDKLEDPTKSTYLTTHIDPSTANGSNGGAHFSYLGRILSKNGGDQGFVVGSELSIADAVLFDIVDLHLRIFKEEMEKHHPELVAHHGRMAALPGLKAYLESDRRLPAVNGNGVG